MLKMGTTLPGWKVQFATAVYSGNEVYLAGRFSISAPGILTVPKASREATEEDFALRNIKTNILKFLSNQRCKKMAPCLVRQESKHLGFFVQWTRNTVSSSTTMSMSILGLLPRISRSSSVAFRQSAQGLFSFTQEKVI